MRKRLAILVCKILRSALKLLGKGSSLPGQIALKICPDILGRMELPTYRIAVTGSNGKTSTVEMIAAILQKDGQRVIYNAEGANQIEGIVTLLLSRATLDGRVKGDVLLLESDERYAHLTFRYFYPTHFVITNLYRDQLTRNGHPEWVYAAIERAVHPETTLVLNADDPLVSCLAKDHAKVKWFGVEHCAIDTAEPRGVYRDGYRCPICREPMEYDWYHDHHIGSYHCPHCGHHRNQPDFAVTNLDLGQKRLTIDQDTTIELTFGSLYNVYNILAAWSVCRLVGVEPAIAAETINRYILHNGRVVTFRIGEHAGTLLISKHENSVSYDMNLDYVCHQEKPCTVLILVDSISRKYFTGETSWLWDIEFERLNNPKVRRIILCGKYCHDLAMRFAYTEIPAQRIDCYETVAQAAETLTREGAEDIYALTCFSDRDKLLNLVQREESAV